MGYLQRGFAYGNRRGFAIPLPELKVEEQTEHDVFGGVYNGGVIRSGQLLNILGRTVIKLSLPVSKIGNPTGDVVLGIRAHLPIGEDILLASKVWGDILALAAYPAVTWIEVEFDTPVTIDERVKIYVEFTGGDASNLLCAHTQGSDVKADEWKDLYTTEWIGYEDNDAAYRYKYY